MRKILSSLVVLALALALTGCITNPRAVGASVGAAVANAHPAIEDVHVRTASGLSGTRVWVRLYVDAATTDLAPPIDAALRAILTGASERPSGFTIDVALTPKPSEVNLNIGALDIEAAADELGLSEQRSNSTISGAIEVLEERYGTWEELHARDGSG